MRAGQRIAVTIWVCRECGNYYASSNARDLSKLWNTDKKGERTFRRSRCPTAACANADRHREPVIVYV